MKRRKKKDDEKNKNENSDELHMKKYIIKNREHAKKNAVSNIRKFLS